MTWSLGLKPAENLEIMNKKAKWMDLLELAVSGDEHE